VIKGTAFLWHQVRLMMSVLFMIGKGEETPEIIDQLFDVDRLVSRPK
jgi:tRNA pseudouridine38/39 synthase